MLRSMMFAAACVVVSAVGPAWAQECTDTYDATAVGTRGTGLVSVFFAPSGPTPIVQIGSLEITSVGGTIELPALTGTWIALSRCQFSTWTVGGAEVGRATGSGVTIGSQLVGVVTLSGNAATNGTYVLLGQGAVAVPETPTEPTPTITAAAGPSPTPARRTPR